MSDIPVGQELVNSEYLALLVRYLNAPTPSKRALIRQEMAELGERLRAASEEVVVI